MVNEQPKPGETMGVYLSRLFHEHGLEPGDQDGVRKACERHQAANGHPAAYELRHAQGTLEVRAGEGDAGDVIVGHAAVFNSLSEELFGFREKIDPGAFDRTLKDGDDVRALWNHNPENVLGRTTSSTLTLSTDKRGLVYEVTPPDTQWARDLLVTMRRGDVTESSFGFITREDSWHQPKDELAVRTLLDVKLLDVSPVTYPAYTSTDVQIGARSLDLWLRGRHQDPPGSRGLNRERWTLQQLAEEKGRT